MSTKVEKKHSRVKLNALYDSCYGLDTVFSPVHIFSRQIQGLVA
jgi:hypothetical protein